MGHRDAQARRAGQARARQRRARRERFAALASLTVVVALVVVIVLGSARGGKPASGQHPRLPATRSAGGSAASGRSAAAVPILEYHVINSAPPQSAAAPALYVPADVFSSQMEALKSGGWHAVTLDALEAYWTRGVSLGPGKPIVISFDNGYASQYTIAAPILKQLGWAGVENLQLTGLPPSEGGLTDAEIRGLIAAGWELDTQGMSHADLIGLDPSQLSSEVATARQSLRTRYGVPANWFSYPLGHYDPAVVGAVRAAGFLGATTSVPGWASPQEDRFRLPRLQVLAGTTGPALLSQIAAAQADTAPPLSYDGPGLA